MNRLRPIPAIIPAAVRSAFGTLRRTPLRCAILLQGVLWASVLGILPAAVIRGSREASISRAREVGADRILVHDGQPSRAGWPWETASRLRLLRWKEVRSVAGYACRPPLLETDAPEAGDCGRRLLAGRWFSQEEIRTGAAVCLIGPKHAAERFGGRPAVGRSIEPPEGGRALAVIGICESVGAGAGLDSFGLEKGHPLRGLWQETLSHLGVPERDFDWIRDDALILVPPPPDPGSRLQAIEVRADPTALGPIARSLRRELIGRGLQPLVIANPIVQVLFSGPMETVDRFLRLTFAMCLAAGTIVVTNLLLLTVMERRREIAVRRVEGATTASIAVQFIVENGTLCLAGALAGIPVALGLAAVRTALDPSGAIRWMFPVEETLRTVGILTVAGLIAGLIPALKAARVQPVEVLAHE